MYLNPGAHYMMKKAFAAVALAGMAMSAQAAVQINEGFANVSTLTSRGWLSYNAGVSGGTSTGWTQGNTGTFNAQAGAPNAYVSASFHIAPDDSGYIDSWLATPTFDASKGANISFYLRAAGEGYADQLSYGFVNADGSLGTASLTKVDPVPSNGWVQYNAWIGADRLGLTRFAFEFAGDANDVNFVGLDSVVVDVPEPASMALLAAGLLGLGAARRRSRA
jgi:hypothetical protein